MAIKDRPKDETAKLLTQYAAATNTKVISSQSDIGRKDTVMSETMA